MNREEALAHVREVLPEQRYIHTIGVMETAKALAEKYGENVEQAEMAAILHDMAKHHSRDDMRDIIKKEQMDERLLLFHHELWHAPVGAYLAKVMMAIESQDILNAIRFHTTGRAGMSLLEKIIYLSDFIEPGRKFPEAEEIRKIAFTDLEKAMRKTVKQSISFLMDKKARIFPDTLECYNDLMLQKEKSKYE
ncbi:bis(5'-nucleosyl)-tetraphosphatase (symmetrical) YqeK [Jeotgalibacillus proteolyticus]|uniref:bis(5'-nucleosyl)-tetraphosphatase (symmetrical) n=1 Tax=Jeotgalibacillus proteolyticus TaxID=2082395 RepID=A0A2S5GEV4_9BACL|nr:bis(5'-nucleosyl)-tetraphosphatase (symmetrical) YqeK [Jeotgalibacillus proteolyticus]PPA71478.1 phosphohydrolase [Jeotgalibacillus proteolyticus]